MSHPELPVQITSLSHPSICPSSYLLSLSLPQFAVAGNIIKKDGFLALYKGLDAGLLRQATYTTARLGIFNNLSAALKDMNGGQVCGWAHACMASSPHLGGI